MSDSLLLNILIVTVFSKQFVLLMWQETAAPESAEHFTLNLQNGSGVLETNIYVTLFALFCTVQY